MRQIKILFVHHVSTIGGASYCLLNIVRELDRSLFCPVVLLKDDGPLAEELHKDGVETVFFPEMSVIPYNKSLFARGSLAAYLSLRRSLPAFRGILLKHKADILYLNNMMLCGYLQAGRECGCKTVLHVREHWPLNEHKRQLKWVRDCVYRYADGLIAINKYSASIFPDKPSKIVYDWIDVAGRDKRVPLDSVFNEDMAGKKVFLYMGGVQRIKGAYEVMKTFCARMKDESCRLLVVGYTKELSGRGLAGKVKQIMYRLGIPTYEYKVKMLARQDSRVVCIPGFYEIMDVMRQACCLLSYYTIPHANLSLAEAIVVGTPVVAARTEESEEYSLGGRLAILYKMNDIDAFESAVKEFAAGNGKDDSAAGDRKIVAEMFSRERNVRLLTGTLLDLVR